MEGKKRVVPGEICTVSPERGKHSHKLKAVLNVQKSAEAIVPGTGRAESTRAKVLGERRTTWEKQNTLATMATRKGIARNAKSMRERIALFRRIKRKWMAESRTCLNRS